MLFHLTWVARLDDLDRLVSPLRIVGRAMMDARRRSTKPRGPGRARDIDAETAL